MGKKKVIILFSIFILVSVLSLFLMFTPFGPLSSILPKCDEFDGWVPGNDYPIRSCECIGKRITYGEENIDGPTYSICLGIMKNRECVIIEKDGTPGPCK